MKRMNQLVEFFVLHSNYSTKRISFSEIAKYLSLESKTLKPDSLSNAVLYIKKYNPEYIIIEDKGDFPKNRERIKLICEIIREIGKSIAIIIVTEHAGEFALLYGVAVFVDIPTLNERSLRIRASLLETEGLYLRNQIDAISTGVFCANKDFYTNYIENKFVGDNLFAQGNYNEAFEKYNLAILFHSKYDEHKCPINDLLGVVLYIRCVACFLYGKWVERTKANYYIKKTIEKILNCLKNDGMNEKHGQMLKEYDFIFLGLRDGWLKRSDYLLFLNEYIF